MKNKKMIFINLVILLLFVGVVFIGTNTWGADAKKAVTENHKQVDHDKKLARQTVKHNPNLNEFTFEKKKKMDLKSFVTEEELEDELEEEEELEDEEVIYTEEEEIQPVEYYPL